MTDWNYDMESAPKDRPILIWSEDWPADVYMGGYNLAAVCRWYESESPMSSNEGFYVECSNYYRIWPHNPVAWAELTDPRTK